MFTHQNCRSSPAGVGVGVIPPLSVVALPDPVPVPVTVPLSSITVQDASCSRVPAESRSANRTEPMRVRFRFFFFIRFSFRQSGITSSGHRFHVAFYNINYNINYSIFSVFCQAFFRIKMSILHFVKILFFCLAKFSVFFPLDDVLFPKQARNPSKFVKKGLKSIQMSSKHQSAGTVIICI